MNWIADISDSDNDIIQRLLDYNLDSEVRMGYKLKSYFR